MAFGLVVAPREVTWREHRQKHLCHEPTLNGQLHSKDTPQELLLNERPLQIIQYGGVF